MNAGGAAAIVRLYLMTVTALLLWIWISLMKDFRVVNALLQTQC